MTKSEYLAKIKQEIFYAKRHFHALRQPVEVAESLIIKGFQEEKINNPYTQNGLRILSSYITSGRIRTTIKLLQEAMKEND